MRRSRFGIVLATLTTMSVTGFVPTLPVGRKLAVVTSHRTAALITRRSPRVAPTRMIGGSIPHLSRIGEAAKTAYTTQVSVQVVVIQALKLVRSFQMTCAFLAGICAAKLKVALCSIEPIFQRRGSSFIPLTSSSSATSSNAVASATCTGVRLPASMEWAALAFLSLPPEVHGALGAVLFLFFNGAFASISSPQSSTSTGSAPAMPRAVAAGGVTKVTAADISRDHWAKKKSR